MDHTVKCGGGCVKVLDVLWKDATGRISGGDQVS
jgi:hypothetical protein